MSPSPTDAGGAAAVDPRIHDFPPGTAKDLGYLLYVAEDQASPTRDAAIEALDKLKRQLGQFSAGSREEAYGAALLSAGVSYARGVARNRRLFQEAKATALERRAINRRMLILTETRQGLLRGTVKLVFIGGLVYAATQLIFDWSPKLQEKPQDWASIAVSLAAMLLAIGRQMGMLRRSERQLYSSYDREIRRARRNQVAGMKQELHLALKIANAAWAALWRDPSVCPPPCAALAELEAVMDLQLDADDLEAATSAKREDVSARKPRLGEFMKTAGTRIVETITGG